MKWINFFVVTALFFSSCSGLPAAVSSSPTPEPTRSLTVTLTQMPTLTAAPTLTPMPTDTPTQTPTPIPTETPTPRPTSVLTSQAPSNPVVDVLNVIIVYDGETVTATFFLKDIPAKIDYNRKGAFVGSTEYSWAVLFDTDDDPNTGGCPGIDSNICNAAKGMDYQLIAEYWNVGGKPASGPLESMLLQVSVFQSKSVKDGSRMVSDGTMQVDMDAKTITLRGKIPPIDAATRVFFATFADSLGERLLQADYGFVPADHIHILK